MHILALLKRPGVRYLLTGGMVYLLELLVIVITVRLGASSVMAVAYSFGVGLVASFTAQKLFTFGDKRTHHRILIPQLAAFSLLVIWNFGFTLLLTDILENVMPPTITRTIAIGITTIWNFYLYKTRIFHKNPLI